MINATFALLTLVVLASGGAASAAPPLAAPSPITASNPDVQAVSRAGSDFGFRLLHLLATDGTKPLDANVFFSPFSVSQALTLVLNGAGGQTQTDMAKALGLEALTQDSINAANVELLPALTSDSKVQIDVANALWANTGWTFLPAFEADAKKFYHAQVTTLDLHSPRAAATINGWVSKNTRGRIPTIVTEEDLKYSTNLLTNAVYFHGQWQVPFEPANTSIEPFYLARGGTELVPLMEQGGEIAYLDAPQFQAAILPYGTGRTSMAVFLPKPGVSVETLALSMTGGTAVYWLGAMQPTEIQLYLPRFRANTREMLKEPLMTLGMGLAFDDHADFDRMCLRRTKQGEVLHVKLDEVLHVATLDVDEQGTVAAAATATIAGMAGAMPTTPPPPPPIMRVDRPFLVLIRDTGTGTLLFAGVIRNPQ